MTSQQLGAEYDRIMLYVANNFPFARYYGFRMGNLYVVYLEN